MAVSRILAGTHFAVSDLAEANARIYRYRHIAVCVDGEYREG